MDMGSVEMSALDLRGDEKTLRIFAEEQNGSVGWSSVFKQVQVFQHLSWWRVL